MRTSLGCSYQRVSGNKYGSMAYFRAPENTAFKGSGTYFYSSLDNFPELIVLVVRMSRQNSSRQCSSFNHNIIIQQSKLLNKVPDT